MRRSDAEGRPADAEGAEQAPAAAPAADPAHPGNGAAGLGLLERAFERLAQAEAELERARAERDEALRRAELERRLVLADEALLDTLASGGDLASLREGIRRALGRPVRIVDMTVRYDVRDEATEVGDDERPLIALSGRTGGPVSSVREGAAGADDGAAYHVMAARRDDEVVGAVLVDGELDAADSVVLRRCARMLATFVSAQGRARGDLALRRKELLEQVLAPPVGGLSETTLRRLAEHGIAPGRPFRILVGDGSPAVLREIDHRFELDFGGALLRAVIGEQLIALVNERNFAQLRELFDAPGARAWGGLLIGHSPELARMSIVPLELELVQRVVGAARATAGPRQSTLVSLESYGALGAFLNSISLEPTKLAIRETLGPLLDYDERHGTELMATAGAYLDLGRSAARVAHRLHVHENTVRQRIDRIARLLGPDWAEGQAGLDHHIMLAAHRLLG
ncbi:MAG: PucR family transcriptional regulator [Microbacteriaceae bacterium]|nr:PucR family transcriptional regulator [Microbacteriaceae bacterium]